MNKENEHQATFTQKCSLSRLTTFIKEAGRTKERLLYMVPAQPRRTALANVCRANR